MRTFFFAAAIALVLAASGTTAAAQILLTDDFDYPVQDSIDGLGGWSVSGLNTPNNIRIVSPGLTYAGYPGSGIGNCARISGFPSDIVLDNFPTITSGTLYMSLMVSVDSLDPSAAIGTTGYIAGFDQSGGSTNMNTQLMIRKTGSGTFNFGIGAGISYAAQTYTVNTTCLVVLKYTWFPGGSTNDSTAIFVFTSGVPSVEPAPSATSSPFGDLVDNGQVFLCNSYAWSSSAVAAARIDGIRVGTTWNETVLTDVKQVSGPAPATFALEQNYPNPFNPSTTVRYSLPRSADVKLGMFNILGQQVATLVDRQQPAGNYSAIWNADGLASGMYICRLQAGGFVATRKMVLLH